MIIKNDNYAIPLFYFNVNILLHFVLDIKRNVDHCRKNKTNQKKTAFWTKKEKKIEILRCNHNKLKRIH